jgi:hypothetical protein
MLKQAIGVEAEADVDQFTESAEIKSFDSESALKIIDESGCEPQPINIPWPPSPAEAGGIRIQ